LFIVGAISFASWAKVTLQIVDPEIGFVDKTL
jgi:hypothetical protein